MRTNLNVHPSKKSTLIFVTKTAKDMIEQSTGMIQKLGFSNDVKLQENKDNIRDLTEILNQKLEKEFEEFCRKMEEKKPKEIVKKAYEITVKEELKEEIKNMRLAEKEKAIMIDQNDLLTEFYHDWLNTDVPLGESLRDTLEDSVAMLTRYYGKQNKFRVDQEIDR